MAWFSTGSCAVLVDKRCLASYPLWENRLDFIPAVNCRVSGGFTPGF